MEYSEAASAATWHLGQAELQVTLPIPELAGWNNPEGVWQPASGTEVSATCGSWEREGISFTREVRFEARSGRLCLRGIIKNKSRRSLELMAWKPFTAALPQGLRLGKWLASEWRVWRQAAQKSDSPVVCQPSDHGENLLYATMEGTEVSDLEESGRPTSIISEPFLVIGRELGMHPGAFLWVGVLEQLNQLGRVVYRLDAQALPECLEVQIPFDGALLAPGQELETSWVWLQGGERWQNLGSQYWQQLVQSNPPRRRQPVPSVYCSWYFYGRSDLTPGVVCEELDWLHKNKWPLDVFQLDSGWEKCFGDWIPGKHWAEWSLEDTARQIASAGFRPGIWTCPFLAARDSELAANHPEWLLREPGGQPVLFRAAKDDQYVLDASHPEVLTWLGDLYSSLVNAGFTYHKLDFTRALVPASPCRYHNRGLTKAQVYRQSMEHIRKALGEDAYLLICGGLYLPVAGLADGQRVGSDVRGQWENPRADTRIRQNLLRTWMGTLWHTDPDSAILRRRNRPFNENPISLGQLNDEEARTIAVNQYLGGGLVCFSERMPELDSDRAALYRHIIPPLGVVSSPVDLFKRPGWPAFHTSRVRPNCPQLGMWQTLAMLNFADSTAVFSPALEPDIFGEESLLADTFLVWEFFTQSFLGEIELGGHLPPVEVPAHGTRLLRLQPVRGSGPWLLGTDRHFSMGGVEIRRWHRQENTLELEFSDSWQVPFHYWLAFRRPDGWLIKRQEAMHGETQIWNLADAMLVK